MTDREKYRQQMNAVSFSEDFRQRTIGLMKQAAQEKETAPMKNKKTVKIIVALAAAFALLTGSVFAVSSLLSAREVAQQMDSMQNDTVFSSAFESEDAVAINQTAIVGDYEMTLLGIASGEQLEFIGDQAIENRHSYVVLAVRNADGTPFSPDDQGFAFADEYAFSPLVEGWAPHYVNAWSLNCSGHAMYIDGVCYYLFDYTNLELFADRTVYLSVYEGLFPSKDIFTLNEDGSITFAEGYTGEGTLFTLPVTPSRADREAAMALLEDIGILSETGEPADEEVYSMIVDTTGDGPVTVTDENGTVIVTDENGTYTVVMDENGTYTVVMDENGTVAVEGNAGEVTTSGDEQQFTPTTVAD